MEAAHVVALSKPAPKVTRELIEGKIASTEYVRSGVLTISIITMQNGFKITGISAPASAENFDQHVGETYAFDDAFKKLWQFEGYLLRQQLFDLETPAVGR